MKDENLRNIVQTILVPHEAFERAVKRIRQCFEGSKGSAEPVCLLVLGESRTGKSRAQEIVAREHPKQRLQEGVICPILGIQIPSTPSEKGMAQTMLKVLGDPAWNKGTEQELTERLVHLLKECQTRQIQLDDFQHFYSKTSHRVLHAVADWLKLLVDRSKVGLVVAGLPECRHIIMQNAQLAGRFLAPAVISRFRWEHEVEREDFLDILAAFHENLARHFDLPDFCSDEMAFRIYCATGGLMGYLTKFLRQAVWNSVDGGARKIGLPEMHAAFAESVLTDEVNAINPFDRAFSAQPDDALLARVAKIGVEELPPPPPSRPGRRRRQKAEAPV